MEPDASNTGTPAYDALPLRDRRLVDEYLRNGMVQWRAYRDVFYTGDKTDPDKQETIRTLASRKFTDANLKAALQERMKALSMLSEEVVYRLTEQGRNLQMQYLQPDGSVDLEGLIRDGLAHLVRGTRYDAKGNLVVEFHDVQAALRDIGKTQGIFRDTHELSIREPVRIIDFNPDVDGSGDRTNGAD